MFYSIDINSALCVQNDSKLRANEVCPLVNCFILMLGLKVDPEPMWNKAPQPCVLIFIQTMEACLYTHTCTIIIIKINIKKKDLTKLVKKKRQETSRKNGRNKRI